MERVDGGYWQNLTTHNSIFFSLVWRPNWWWHSLQECPSWWQTVDGAHNGTGTSPLKPGAYVTLSWRILHRMAMAETISRRLSWYRVDSREWAGTRVAFNVDWGWFNVDVEKVIVRVVARTHIHTYRHRNTHRRTHTHTDTASWWRRLPVSYEMSCIKWLLVQFFNLSFDTLFS